MVREQVASMEKEELLEVFHAFCKRGLRIRLCVPQQDYTESDDAILSGLQIIQREIDNRIAMGLWQ